MQRGYVILIVGAALLISGIVIFVLWAVPFAGTILRLVRIAEETFPEKDRLQDVVRLFMFGEIYRIVCSEKDRLQDVVRLFMFGELHRPLS